MRILQVNSAPDWGGGEVQTLLLCSGLLARGHEVTLACRPASVLETRCRAAGVPTLSLPLKGELDLHSARELARCCRTRETQILHAHLARDYPLIAFASLSAPRVCPVISRHVLFPLRMLLLQHFVLHRIKAVIAVCAALQPLLVKESGVPAELIHVIPNGIDTATFADAATGRFRAELGLSANTPLVGMVAQIDANKGIDTFLRAIPAMAAAHPRARFVIAGSLRQHAYVAEMRALARQLEIDDGIWLGAREDVRSLMKDLDVLVLLSRRSETSPLVLLEAMSAGTPVVATNLGGIPDIIGDNERGLLIASDDPNALAAAVTELLAHPAHTEQLRQAARQFVRSHYDAGLMVERTIALYRQLHPD